VEKKQHPSYGMIRLSRSSIGGGGTALFGSSIMHNDVIRLSISKGIMEREGSEDRFFARESMKVQEYGVLSAEDREAFERLIGELGHVSLNQQLRMIGEADEQLRRRERALLKEGVQRIRLIRTLGVAGGAAVFLILI